MAEMEKEGRPPENKRSRKPAHPVKREINEEMKVFSDSEAGETELFIPSAPFGLLCRLRGGGGTGARLSVSAGSLGRLSSPSRCKTEANSWAASPKSANLRFDGGEGGGILFNLTNPRLVQMLPGEGTEPQWRVSMVQWLS